MNNTIFLRHHDATESGSFGELKLAITTHPHGGMVIECFDEAGSKTDVWIENNQGVMALRVYAPNVVEAGEDGPVSYATDIPFINSRFSLKQSVVLLGDPDTRDGVTVGLSLADGGGKADLQGRISGITSQAFDEALAAAEVASSRALGVTAAPAAS